MNTPALTAPRDPAYARCVLLLWQFIHDPMDLAYALDNVDEMPPHLIGRAEQILLEGVVIRTQNNFRTHNRQPAARA